jgi:hypothetical protein
MPLGAGNQIVPGGSASSARSPAHSRSTPGTQPEARQGFGLWLLFAALAAVLVVLVVGATVAYVAWARQGQPSGEKTESREVVVRVFSGNSAGGLTWQLDGEPVSVPSSCRQAACLGGLRQRLRGRLETLQESPAAGGAEPVLKIQLEADDPMALLAACQTGAQAGFPAVVVRRGSQAIRFDTLLLAPSPSDARAVAPVLTIGQLDSGRFCVEVEKASDGAQRLEEAWNVEQAKLGPVSTAALQQHGASRVAVELGEQQKPGALLDALARLNLGLPMSLSADWATCSTTDHTRHDPDRLHPEEAPSSEAESETAAAGGSLPREVIQRIVRQQYPKFRQCYEQGLARNPNLSGSVKVRFVIGRAGEVTRASSEGSDFPDPKVVDCMVREYRKLRFPPPEGGTVTVVYPIKFSPG